MPSKSRTKRAGKTAKKKSANKIKGRRSVPTGGKGSASRKSAKSAKTRAKAPAAKTKATTASRGKAPVKSKATKAPMKAVKAPARVPAKISPIGKAAKVKTKGAGPNGHLMQGHLEFEAEPAITTRSGKPLEMPPAPTPRRRGAAKPGSPDWPGDSLTVGMMAPEFSLPSTLGRKVALNEFRGKRVILYFYPKDDTPGCTMEACAFRDHLPLIESKDAVVLGISLDDELSHQRFAQKYNLPFPLLSDVDALVSRQYGTYKEKNLYGRSYWGIERTTFVIDREGRVENVFRRVKVEGHAEEVMATLAI